MLSPEQTTGAVQETRSSDKLGLKFPSSPANVSTVRKSIEQFCQTAGLDAPACEEVGLVVNEALANVVRHAYAGAEDRPVEVSVQRKDGGVQIDIRDWGNGMDPACVAKPERDPLTPGGIGLICIRRLMDQVQYVPQPDGMLLSMTRTTRGSLAAEGGGSEVKA
jgi:anti-sigma regulatory factor (Ser/Thr protein kinase)